MNTSKHHIDELFRKAQQDFAETPSDASWEKILSRLNEKEINFYRKRSAFYRRVAFLLFFMILGLLAYQLRKQKSKLRANITEAKINPPVFSVPNEKTGAPISSRIVTAAKPTGNPTTSVASVLLQEKYLPEKKSVVDRYNNKNGAAVEYLYTGPVIWDLPEHGDPFLSRTVSGKAVPIKKILPGAIAWGLSPRYHSLMMDAPTTPGIVHNSGPASGLSFVTYLRNDWVGYILDNDAGTGAPSRDDKAHISSREHHGYSFSLGANVSIPIKRHWSLQTGFGYSRSIIGIDSQMLYASSPSGRTAFKYTVSSGYGYIMPGFPVNSDTIQAGKAEHYLQTISLPLEMAYNTGYRRWRIQAYAGLVLSYITSADLKTEINGNGVSQMAHITRLSGMNPFYLNTTAGLTIEHKIDKHWYAGAMGNFVYALTAITRRNTVSTYPFSIGAGFQLRYSW